MYRIRTVIKRTKDLTLSNKKGKYLGVSAINLDVVAVAVALCLGVRGGEELKSCVLSKTGFYFTHNA